MFALLATVSLAAVGCTAGSDAKSATASNKADLASGRAADGSASAASSVAPRSIIYTATMRVSATKPTTLAKKAREIAESSSGFVSDENANNDGESSLSMIIKVPPPALTATLDQLGDLGHELSRTSNSEDVNGQVVDLEARLASARTSVERVRGYLGQTNNVAELAAIEAELTKRETDLEILTGQQRELMGRVEMATVTFEVVSNDSAKAAKFLDDVPGFGSALSTGLTALWSTAKVVVAVVGFAIPFLVPAIVVVLLLRRFRRRRPRRGQPTVAPLPLPVMPNDPSTTPVSTPQ
jgi:glycine cleavage system regulatory protein